jgi:hypothetical protein
MLRTRNSTRISTHRRSNDSSGVEAASQAWPALHGASQPFAASGEAGPALPLNSTAMNGWMSAIHSVDVIE